MRILYTNEVIEVTKTVKRSRITQDAEDIVMKLDDFKQSQGASQGYKAKWNADRPTTGFKGNRTVQYTDKAGNPSEVAFRWSISKNTYVPYDLLKRNETILKPMRWNVNRSTKAKWYSDRVYKISKADNAVLRRLLRELRAEDPVRYFEIMGDTRIIRNSYSFSNNISLKIIYIINKAVTICLLNRFVFG